MFDISLTELQIVCVVKFLILPNILNLFLLQVTCVEGFNLVSHNPDDISFYLFLPPAGNSTVEEIQYLNDFSLSQSHFIPNVITVMFIHGYADSVFENLSTLRIINAYLSSGIRGNFIGVNWDKLSTPPGSNPLDFVPTYFEVLPNMPIVGKRIAEFITWLRVKGVQQFNQVHLIGHSLGAHIAGTAGNEVQKLGNGERIRRITGLDPAGPLLEFPIWLERVLNKNDANFVDAIHTSAGLFGNIETNGDVDIYVNNGVVQPGCWSPDILIRCSHIFAIRVYVASFSKVEIACKCHWWSLILGDCQSEYCIDPIMVGPYISESARSIYQLKTSANP